jgi:hypothetical protein
MEHRLFLKRICRAPLNGRRRKALLSSGEAAPTTIRINARQSITIDDRVAREDKQ